MGINSNNICPLNATEKRLTDCLNLFIETKNNYFDPEVFRLKLNSCIQTLRTVTFILQKNRSVFSKFDSWYKQWQDKMCNDSILKWLKEARNFIEKEGDLLTLSKARISVVESWFSNPIFEMEIPPLTKTEHIAKLLTHPHISNKEIYNVDLLRFERRWVDSKLPDYEILESLAYSFQFLSGLLCDAHISLLGKSQALKCNWCSHFISLENKLPPCMIAQEWDRTIWVDIKSGQVLTPAEFLVERSSEMDEEAEKRYPILRNKIACSNLREEATYFFEIAKTMLAVDGHHYPVAIIGYPDGHKEVHQLWMIDRTEKHLAFRKLAAEIDKTGANSLILINEAWSAPIEGTKFHAQGIEHPERKEILHLIAINDNNETYTHEISFERDENGKIKLGKESEPEYKSINILTPIIEVWSNKIKKSTV